MKASFSSEGGDMPPDGLPALQPTGRRKKTPQALDRQVLSVPRHHLLPLLTESAVQLTLYFLSSTHFQRERVKYFEVCT